MCQIYLSGNHDLAFVGALPTAPPLPPPGAGAVVRGGGDDVPIDNPNGRISCKLIAVDAGLPKTKPVEEQLKLFKPPNSYKNVSILRVVFVQIFETKKLNKKVRMIVSMKHAAVMLEQASYCYLLSIPPMLHKYGFHLVLFGNRYYISDQRQHAIRAYRNALFVYRENGWSYISDHVHYNVGSHLSLATQNVFLNEFSHVVQSMGMKFEVYNL
ncbi:hypothetical protein ZIOFF_071388 [Zingiber officinale]|uniref:Uncharacterized protein n=1 Tax=Zingiber officinale TaxID=94328 RepID=A0A8J5C3P5_ZINOF|nr:hypothetical protein ZIOFF_071388 [Zingiber officinale]